MGKELLNVKYKFEKWEQLDTSNNKYIASIIVIIVVVVVVVIGCSLCLPEGGKHNAKIHTHKNTHTSHVYTNLIQLQHNVLIFRFRFLTITLQHLKSLSNRLHQGKEDVRQERERKRAGAK